MHELRLGCVRTEPLKALLGECCVHRRERDLDDRGRLLLLEVPRMERMRDPGPEAERVGKAERRVVLEAELAERDEIPPRIDAEVVVAVALDRPGETPERRGLRGKPVEL